MKFIFPFAAALLSVACTNSNIRPISNAEAPPSNAPRAESVIAHTTENQPGNAVKKSPLGEAIDTKELDAAVTKAEQAAASPKDATAKKALAEAYFNRGVALTEAKQYGAALGDYRRAIKNDPGHAGSKQWIDTITAIFTSMGRPVPKEGEEPSPLPVAQK
jgi:tetratricopeptide (TPR) repeat protein